MKAASGKCSSYNPVYALNPMKQIRLKTSDLFEIDPQTAERPKEFAAITEYVLKHYGFLPKPIAVTVEKDEVVISYPEEPDAKREEAARLAERAVSEQERGGTKRQSESISACLNYSLHFMLRAVISQWHTWN